MYCPFCRHSDSRVVDSRATDDGTAIRRRRQCPECERRFTTVEQVTLAVVKRSGVTEPFVRTKVIDGVRKACKGRPVDEHALAQLAQRVEENIRAGGMAEIPAPEVGLAILGPLRELDEVAYLRFASVYRNFESVDDFETEISLLRSESADFGPAGETDAATMGDVDDEDDDPGGGDAGEHAAGRADKRSDEDALLSARGVKAHG